MSLQSQLAQAIRDLVHNNKLKPGDRLPSSRAFALELSVSRVTITAVLDQLAAEGYLEGKRGSGVFVAADLPDLPIAPLPDPQSPDTFTQSEKPIRPFAMASPAAKEFPHREWAKLFETTWRNPTEELLNNVDLLGWWNLRAAISEHLRVWRGVHCSPAQIVVTSGLVESLELISSAILGKDKHVLMEEPGHQVIRNVLCSHGVSCHPIRVDDQGFDINRAPAKNTKFRAVFLTPSRHFPLGMTLPLSRRLQLLNWASENDAYIVEDDFDGEFRYQGQPLPAMMSLDQNTRVIYVGSFSKVMFPALRLGFMVLPSQLVGPVSDALARTGQRASLIAQPVLAQFILNGGFSTHIRRMRRLYAGRQKALVMAVEKHAQRILEVDPEPGGMHLIARLGKRVAPHLSDIDAAKRANDAGISARPLADFFAGRADEQGLVLGYSAFPEDVLDAAVEKLSHALTAG